MKNSSNLENLQENELNLKNNELDLGEVKTDDIENDEITTDEVVKDVKVQKKKDKKHKNQDKNSVKKKKQIKWAITIICLTFFLSGLFSFASEFFIGKSGIVVAFIILFALVFISIIADIIGVAAASCSVEPFLAMASRKIKGAKKAVSLVKHAEKVTSICCDVIGDICGIISGAAVSAIIMKLFVSGASTMEFVTTILLSSFVAALTVGGKAIGKKIAMDNSQKIVFFVAKVLSIFSKK